MRLAADLHLHSRHARATSREADLEGYYRWALVKGIQVVGTHEMCRYESGLVGDPAALHHLFPRPGSRLRG